MGTGQAKRDRGFLWLAAMVIVSGGANWVRADAFTSYAAAPTFELPTGAGAFDVLGDGRLVLLSGTDVLTETAVGSRIFSTLGTLAGADFSSFGGGFLRVSPDGTKLAVGNGGGASFGNFEVGVFNVSDLSGNWFGAGHFDAAWYDNQHLALTTRSTFAAGDPGKVTLLDTLSNSAAPTNPVIMDNIGGGSGGVAFDAAGNLYTGNGFAIEGPSATGEIRAVDRDAWSAALTGGLPADFENGGVLVADLLSAASLGFDAEGNLHVGGGEFGGGDSNFAALVRSSAVMAALTGGGSADRLDSTEVRLLDPDAISDANFYGVNFNAITGELYLRDGSTVYPYVVPEPTTLALLSIGAFSLLRRRAAA